MNTPKIRFKGFKDDWEQRKLSEICERITRKNRNNESDLPLTIASQFGLIDQRDFFNKVVAAKDMSNYYLLKKGEFAYNKSYSNGFDYGSIKRLNAYKQGCLSTLYICFGITSDEVESDYLECFFDTLKWYGDLSMICAEGARNHGLLNVDTKGFFDEVTVDLPKSLEEQKRISVYMNALNRLITLHQRKCDETKQLKKFMLQKMFPKNGEKNPKIRFEGFTDDWEQRKVGKVTKELLDYDNFSSGLPLLTSSRSGLMYQSEYRGNATTENENTLFSVVPLNACTYRHMSDDSTFHLNINTLEKGLVSKEYPVFQENESNLKFIVQYINSSNSFTKFCTEQKKGGTRTRLYYKTLCEYKLMMPSIKEQNKTANFFDTLDHLITLHQRKCEKLKELKKYMLHNMFV